MISWLNEWPNSKACCACTLLKHFTMKVLNTVLVPPLCMNQDERSRYEQSPVFSGDGSTIPVRLRSVTLVQRTFLPCTTCRYQLYFVLACLHELTNCNETCRFVHLCRGDSTINIVAAYHSHLRLFANNLEVVTTGIVALLRLCGKKG